MNATAARTSRSTEPRTAGLAVLLVASGATFIAFLDVTVVNVAFPALAETFAGTSVSDLSWVVSIYAVVFAAQLTPAGQLADVIGRRRLFLAGIMCFTVASALCAVAPSAALLVAARAVQGAGAAMMIPAALGIVLVSTPPERRAAAVGLWGASSSLAAATGPSLGGVIVDTWGWRAVFLINVPIGIAIVWTAMRVIPRDVPASRRLPDALGTVLVAAGIGLAVAGLTKGGDWGWDSAATIATMAAGGVLAVAALLRARNHPAPAIEMALWRDRTFAVSSLTSLLLGAAVFAWLLISTLFLTGVWHYSILDTGLAVSPGALASAAAALLVGRRAGVRVQRMAVSGGALLLAVTSVWMYTSLGAQPRFLALWLPMSLLGGAAIGASFTALFALAVSAVAPERFAAATGMNMTARQLGGAFGVAALAAILGGGALAGTQRFLDVYLFCALAAGAAATVGIAMLRAGPRSVAP